MKKQHFKIIEIEPYNLKTSILLTEIIGFLLDLSDLLDE